MTEDILSTPLDPERGEIRFGDFVCPLRLKLYPTIGLAAINKHMGGGWRIWVISQAVDKIGSGSIKKADLEFTCRVMGVSEKNTGRWIAEAVEFGFFKGTYRRKSGDTFFDINGVSNVAKMLGLDHVDHHCIWVDALVLVSKGWRSMIWDGYIAINHNNSMISRESLAKISGVERHRQRRLEKKSHVVNRKNIVLTNLPEDNITGMREQGKAAYSVKGKACYRIPDSRSSSFREQMGRRGRARKINKELNSSLISCFTGAGSKSSTQNSHERLFFQTDKKAERAMRRYGREDRNIPVVFAFAGNTPGRNPIGLWKAIGR